MRRIAIAFAVCSFVSLAGPAFAQDTASAPVPLQVWLRREAAPFAEPRYTAIITAGRKKFAYRVPEEFFLRGDPRSGTFTLASAAGNTSITFSLLPSDSSDGSGFSGDALRDRALRECPNGKITQEFPASCPAGGGSGFDLQWKAANDIVECRRVMFISTPAGMVEFTATTSSNRFESFKSTLDSMLLTFILSTDGVIKVPPLQTDS